MVLEGYDYAGRPQNNLLSVLISSHYRPLFKSTILKIFLKVHSLQ